MLLKQTELENGYFKADTLKASKQANIQINKILKLEKHTFG